MRRVQRLCQAATRGKRARVKRLLSPRVFGLFPATDPNVTGRRGLTPLQCAALMGHVDVMRVLLEAGAGPRGRSAETATALHYAALAGHEQAARLLLENAARVNAWDDGERTPLHQAAAGGHVDVMRLLIEKGAEVNARDQGGATPLHRIARGAASGLGWTLDVTHLRREDAVGRDEGREGAARILLEHGAKPNALDAEGLPPIHAAVVHGAVSLLRALLDAGAEVTWHNNAGETLLHLAALHDCAEIAGLLLEAGAGVDAETAGQHVTPLQVAAMQNHLGVGRVLVEAGVDVNARNQLGFTAFRLARMRGETEFAEMLKAAGGRK